jgi:hypothetical protein
MKVSSERKRTRQLASVKKKSGRSQPLENGTVAMFFSELAKDATEIATGIIPATNNNFLMALAPII